jgi:nicotinamidase-related amidase
MLNTKDTTLLIVDIQGKLANLMHEKALLFENVQKLVKGFQALGIPILWAEQNPQGLGPTVPVIAELLSNIQPINKMSFSCCENDRFIQALKSMNRKQVVITGIETHICVYQTAVNLVNLGYTVEVAVDAVSSRTLVNKEIGLQKMKDSGVGLTSVETALFELLKVAEGETFKQILEIVK